MNYFRTILSVTIVLQLFANGQTTYYCRNSSLAANDPENWSTSRDGTYIGGISFGNNYDTFVIQNGQTVTTSVPWNISGSGSTLIIEDGGTLTASHLVSVTYFEVQNGGTYVHSVVSAVENGTPSDIPGTINRVLASTSTITFLKWAGGGSAPVSLPSSYYWGNLKIDISSLGGNWINSGFDGGRIMGDLTIENTGGGSNEFIFSGTSRVYGKLYVNGGILNVSNSSSGAANLTFQATDGINHTGGIIKTSGSDSVEVVMGSVNKPAYFYSIGGSSFVNNNINFFTGSAPALLVLLSDLPIAVNRRLVSQSNLDCGIYAIKGAGTVTVSNRLFLGAPNGITASGSAGNIQVTGDRVYHTGCAFIYKGSSAQNTGDGLPATIDTLIINNSNGVTLTANVSIHDRLVLQQGTLNTEAYTITANNTLRTNGHIIGNLKKTSVSGSQTYDVGTANGYTPVTAILAGQDDFTVKATGGRHPNAGANSLNMYWTLTAGANITSADLTFQYLSGDIAGTESGYDLARWSGSAWETQAITVNTTAHTATKNGITAFSDWTLGESGSLPVELTSFRVTVSNSITTLVWSTATEVNNYGFEVERRQSAMSNQLNAGSWLTIGFVQGAGTSNSPDEYSYTDARLPAGRYEYRLKQIDLDGSLKYSQSVEVEVGKIPKEFTLLQNYPNPFNPSTTIRYSLPSSANVKLAVYDQLGREIATLVNEEQSAGWKEVEWNAAGVSSGMYFYQLQANDKNEIRKMLLIK